MAQKQIQKTASPQKRVTEEIAGEQSETTTATTMIDGAAVDDLLEEIDSVLEVNAKEFVENYIQKGGE